MIAHGDLMCYIRFGTQVDNALKFRQKINGPASLRMQRTRDGSQDLEGDAAEHTSLWAWVCIQPTHDAVCSGHLLLLSLLTHFLQCLHSPAQLPHVSRFPSVLQLSCSVPRKVNLCKKKIKIMQTELISLPDNSNPYQEIKPTVCRG